jgi:hypothetical protein
MKHVQFTVTIEFTDKVTDDNELMEVAENIARVIKLEVGGMGISPENSEALTETIEVAPHFLGESVKIKAY